MQVRYIQSFVEFSCALVFLRKWFSTYEALEYGRPDGEGLMQLHLKQCEPKEMLLLVVVGDHTAWCRVWAETLAERSYLHQASAISSQLATYVNLFVCVP
jgi:hypothetical protein